jgi:hypothetical protein
MMAQRNAKDWRNYQLSSLQLSVIMFHFPFSLLKVWYGKPDSLCKMKRSRMIRGPQKEQKVMMVASLGVIRVIGSMVFTLYEHKSQRMELFRVLPFSPFLFLLNIHQVD